MQIRPYVAADYETCLKIFRSNVPAYFAASDEPEFERFLSAQMEPFWVAVDNGIILACGGIALDYPEANIATLCWGMVAADKHRHGIGSALLQHRINYVATERPTTRLICANTTQLAQAFFERKGFAAVHVATGGYGAGLDYVVMQRLNVRQHDRPESEPGRK
jgi:GNAT superfamily N-acetyltransferase